MPGQKASFGVIKAAQARGDFDVLTERGRRALRVHLKGDLGIGPEGARCRDCRSAQLGMIPKSGHRFSDQIMRKNQGYRRCNSA